MTSAFPQPDRVPRLAGKTSEEVSDFLLAMLEFQKKKGICDKAIYTPFLEAETQRAVTGLLRAKNFTCSIHSSGSGLDWYVSTSSPVAREEHSDLSNIDSSISGATDYEVPGLKYDDLVAVCALLGPIVGIVYGAFNGDIIHGFLVGFAVGMVPFLPMLIIMPFILIWEKFFENR
ncbi:MAG: hypothetical protein IT342_23135 [Candidatus Melainabacteria bacterium]|nr:hypothetical protein [Candidatus Melainabacteria bacterium]